MKYLITLAVALVCGDDHESGHHVKARHETVKPSCSSHERALKTCTLRLPPLVVQIEPTKVLLNDGVFRHVVEGPQIAHSGVWDEIKLTQIKHHRLMEFFIWQPSKDHGPLEELHWIVARVKEDQVEYGVDEIIQRRSPKHVQSGKGKGSSTMYNYDPRLQPVLQWTGDGILWKVGPRSGRLAVSKEK